MTFDYQYAQQLEDTNLCAILPPGWPFALLASPVGPGYPIKG